MQSYLQAMLLVEGDSTMTHIENHYEYDKTASRIVYIVRTNHQYKKSGCAVEVKDCESGRCFFLQGDAAQKFRADWGIAQDYNIPLKTFLNRHSYGALFG